MSMRAQQPLRHPVVARPRDPLGPRQQPEGRRSRPVVGGCDGGRPTAACAGRGSPGSGRLLHDRQELDGRGARCPRWPPGARSGRAHGSTAPNGRSSRRTTRRPGSRGRTARRAARRRRPRSRPSTTPVRSRGATPCGRRPTGPARARHRRRSSPLRRTPGRSAAGSARSRAGPRRSRSSAGWGRTKRSTGWRARRTGSPGTSCRARSRRRSIAVPE